MTQRRKIEVFTAGCPACAEAVQLVQFLAGTKHDIEIRDMHDAAVAAAASGYGIRRLPAIVIDGRLADRCAGRGPDETTLIRAIAGGHGFTPSRHPGKPRRPGIG
jgi:glutaredoxin 3